MKALFIVESPLQLLNAIEAKCQFNIANEDSALVVLKGASEKSFQQQRELINREDWEKVDYINSKFRSIHVFHLMSSINRVVEKNNDAESVFIGEYRSIVMRHAVNVINPENVIVLDDGNATIHLARNRAGYDRYPGILSGVKYSILFKLTGVDDRYIDKVTFFTIYDVVPAKPDRIVKNTYSVLKRNFNNKKSSKEIIFLGCPFVETKTVSRNFSKDSYLRLLTNVREDVATSYNVDSITYVAHRREAPGKLETIASIEGVTVVDYNEPIEMVLAKKYTKPLVIATFFSGAIDTLINMFGNEVKFVSFRLPSSVIDDDKLSTINGYYDYYKIYSMVYGMKIIQLHS